MEIKPKQITHKALIVYATIVPVSSRGSVVCRGRQTAND